MRKSLTALLTLLLCTVAAQNARAQADVGYKGAGFELGIVSPEDVDATFGVKGFMDLGTLAPNVAMSTHLGFWSSSNDSFDGGEFTLRDISLGMRTVYMFQPASSGMRPFAGGGLGLHFLHAEWDVPDQTIGGFFFPGYQADDSSTKLGFEFGGGLQFPMGDSRSFLTEAWFGSVDGMGTFSIHAGMSFGI